LDVFDDEPNIHPALLENEHVVLLPHIGTATVETQVRSSPLQYSESLKWHRKQWRCLFCRTFEVLYKKSSLSPRFLNKKRNILLH